MTALQRALLEWYAAGGRAHLPWRQTRDPYAITVSEFMLQQTQVDRVLPKFQSFVARFPDFQALAAARTSEVLRLWKGLGYNSRALRLKQLAEDVVRRFGGSMPSAVDDLRSLPGVGAYTVAAIRAFAFEFDDAATDTNVRRIVHRLSWGIEYPPAAGLAEVDARAQALVPAGRGHDWNSAMMDLGSSLCTARAPKCLLCPLQPFCAAAPIDSAALGLARAASVAGRVRERIPFERTTRYARGRIIDRLRELPDGKRISLLDLHRDVTEPIGRSGEEFDALIGALSREGLIQVRAGRVKLRD